MKSKETLIILLFIAVVSMGYALAIQPHCENIYRYYNYTEYREQSEIIQIQKCINEYYPFPDTYRELGFVILGVIGTTIGIILGYYIGNK